MDRQQKFAAIALVLAFLSQPSTSNAGASSPSLFFTKQETSEINRSYAQLPQTQLQRPIHLLHLDSILYFTPTQWSVWLQGKKWTPEMRDDRFTIQEVGRDYLRLKATLQNGRVVDQVKLRTNQALNLLTGEVQ
ncbi:MAG: hypothetical protein EOM37_06795 [Proteobacteria bacterium]|jgi:hypothetical protein|nr:hypothetical protein [Alphaproteobacteria bacterium]NCC03735.1 hypothetical protein [Pseudomonadota bacterium]